MVRKQTNDGLEFKQLITFTDVNDLNSKLKELEGIPAVQEQFKDSEGNFDKKAFDQFYDSMCRRHFNRRGKRAYQLC